MKVGMIDRLRISNCIARFGTISRATVRHKWFPGRRREPVCPLKMTMDANAVLDHPVSGSGSQSNLSYMRGR
jgi:hypothetical protein